MRRIVFVVPPLDPKRFSGGIWCIMEYADGLARAGYEVSVVPMLPSPRPEWFPRNPGLVPASSARERMKVAAGRVARGVGRVVRAGAGRRKVAREELGAALAAADFVAPQTLPMTVQRGLAIEHLRTTLPDADVTVATSFETAYATALAGRGRLCYFLQHFEPYFRDEYPDPEIAEREALLSYRLGLRLIANSSWLQHTVSTAFPGTEVALCPNAIDHATFTGEPRPPQEGRRVRVISYGGREARWKGFAEMAAAMQIARERLPEWEIDWRVYGAALLPPDNDVARYTSLGFLRPPQLAAAYRDADILLSASWYESFPLFPIEAMACGLAVITTQPGTEEYAIPDETAEVVPPRDPAAIADAFVRLITDPARRHRIAVAGNAASRRFNWPASVERMQAVLAAAHAGATPAPYPPLSTSRGPA